MIRISVIGRLGQDATVNNVNEKTVINFSMAYSEKYKNQQGQDVDRTTWVSCAYWTDKTNVASYLKKGTLIEPLSIRAPSSSNYYLVSPKGGDQNKKTKLFKSWLRKSMGLSSQN